MGLWSSHAMEWLGRQQRLDPFAETLQRSVTGLFAAGGGVGRATKNALHGTWLGHPLHPALTDVPIGAWTTAAVLDVLEATGRSKFGPAADAAVGLGLVGAGAAAVSGLTDWSATDGVARRQGLVHGWLNLSVAALYILSLILRRRGPRPVGRAVAMIAFAIANASAYIGGHLVSGERVGVDHARDIALPGVFTPVMLASDLPDNTPTPVDLDGTPLVVVRREGQVVALAATCAHLGGPLADGTFDGDSIICPWHGSRFSLTDGRVLDGPSAFAQPRLNARIRDGQVEVRGGCG
jgi:nitrite reductase/ring-hydroxylating ferredoxin subunit/uncharacterized membrane protein